LIYIIYFGRRHYSYQKTTAATTSEIAMSNSQAPSSSEELSSSQTASTLISFCQRPSPVVKGLAYDMSRSESDLEGSRYSNLLNTHALLAGRP
jgi:hypothetical protein